ncbi:hypothetical protein ES708_18413 [subsurface metagenome]
MESRRFAEQATGQSLTAPQVSRFWYGRALTYIVHHPFDWFALTTKKFLLFWSAYEPPVNFDYYFHQRYTPLLRIPFINLVVYMPFAIMGIFVSLRRWRQDWLLLSVIGIVCVSVVMFYMGHRYRLVVMPLVIVMASAGCFAMIGQLKSRSIKKFAWLALLSALFIIQFEYAQKRISKTSFSQDYYNLSLAHMLRDDMLSSITWGQLAVKADPLFKNAHYNLGVAFMKEKVYDQALGAFTTVIRLDSTMAGAQRNVGGLLIMQKQYRQARRHLEISLLYEPDHVIALMNLGLAHYYLMEYAKAVQAWERLLAIDPENEQARRNVEAVRRYL